MRDELLSLLAERDRLDARLASAVADFDAAQLWDVDAATSVVAWLRDRGRMSRRDVQRLVSLAKGTRQLPVTRDAWRAGGLSSGQVQTIVAQAGSKMTVFAEHEADAIPTLEPLSVLDTEQAMRRWRALADAADGDEVEVAEPPSTLHLSPTLDDRQILDGNLDADDGAIVATALRVAETHDGADEARTPAERRADALVDVCRFFLDNQRSKPGGRHRPHVNLIVNVEDLSGGVAGGARLPKAVIDRYCCDSAVHRVLTDGRRGILDVGTATRVLTAAMWTALVIRDGHCRFPSCDRPATWCDGHHIRWVSNNGPTRLDNLVLLCRRHHKRLHQPGWHAKLLPDATFEVTTPDGLVRTSHPPGTLRPFP